MLWDSKILNLQFLASIRVAESLNSLTRSPLFLLLKLILRNPIHLLVLCHFMWGLCTQMDGEDEFTSAGSRLARLKASANAAASQISKSHNVDDIIDILDSGSGGASKKKNNNVQKGPSPPKIRKLAKEQEDDEEEAEVLSSDAKEDKDEDQDSLLDSSQDVLQAEAHCPADNLISSDDDEDVVDTHHRKNAKEHTNRAAFYRYDAGHKIPIKFKVKICYCMFKYFEQYLLGERYQKLNY